MTPFIGVAKKHKNNAGKKTPATPPYNEKRKSNKSPLRLHRQAHQTPPL